MLEDGQGLVELINENSFLLLLLLFLNFFFFFLIFDLDCDRWDLLGYKHIGYDSLLK